MYEVVNKFRIGRMYKYYHYIHKSDYVFSGHRHSDIELNIILSGAMEITCGDGVFKAEKGSMVLIPSGAFHQNRVIGTEYAEMVVIQFEVNDALFGKNFSVYSVNDDTEKLIEIYCRDMEENAVLEEGNCLRVNESSKKLFEVFMQYAVSEEQSVSLENDENSVIYKTAVKFMLDNITEKLTVSDIARACGVCMTTVKNIFSYYTGRGCITYFNELKLDKAKELLSEGQSCAHVSNALGFSSQAYFSKRFKQMFGSLPSDIKKQNNM